MTIVQRINSARCGCDGLAIGKKLITIDQALSVITKNSSPVADVEKIALSAAKGRVLAEAVRSRGMVPPFDNSAMDGYAINTETLCGDGPWRLAVANRIAAGQSNTSRLSGSSAIQIFTGAPIPDGADAVVMQEDVTRLNGTIIVLSKIVPGTHIRRAGEDIAAGAAVIPAGRCLTARDIAACAAAGHGFVLVRRRIGVALLVTGNEMASPGHARKGAVISDVNSPMIGAELMNSYIDFRGAEVGNDKRRG